LAKYRLVQDHAIVFLTELA